MPTSPPPPPAEAADRPVGSGEDDGPDPTGPRFGWRALVRSVLGLTLAVVLLAYALPAIVGTSWEQIGGRLALAGPGALALMTGLLLAGLYSYTFTLAASLPGLSHVRAMMANAVHAMVGNLVPAGAAAGMAATYVMYRSWGFRRRAVSSSLLVTGVWNLLARLSMPVVALLLVALGRVDVPARVQAAGAVGALVGVLLVGTFAAVVVSDRVAGPVARTAARVLRPVARRRPGLDVEALVRDQRARSGSLVRTGGVRMTLGLVGMFALLFALFVVAARTVGLDLGLAQLLTAYCLRQFLTVVALTPGGLGITEAGTAGVLVAFGGDPAAASATALLYAVFSQGMSLPLGLTAWAAWRRGRRAG